MTTTRKSLLLAGLTGAVVVLCVLARIATHLPPVVGTWGWALRLAVIIAVVNSARALARALFDVRGAFRQPGGVGRWAGRHATAAAGTIGAGIVLTTPLYALLRSTAAWWVWAWVLFAVVTMAAQGVFPFLRRLVVGPVAPADGELDARVAAIAEKVGVDVGPGVLLAGAPGSTRCNAYVVGIGRSRRVVVDRAMAAWPAPMVDQVVAHELGHCRLRHTATRLPLTLAVELATLAAAARLLAWAPLLHWAGVASAGDPASYPLLLLLTPLLVLPGRMLVARRDRAQERQADRFALDLLDRPGDFAAMLDHAADGGGAARTLPWWARLTASHPPIDERAEACGLAQAA